MHVQGENECTVPSPHVNPSLPITLNTGTIQ